MSDGATLNGEVVVAICHMDGLKVTTTDTGQARAVPDELAANREVTRSDRIVSGTSNIVVNSGTSTISFTTAGSQRMVVDASGNVGIGTKCPA
jgi:hypothetical protein